MEGRLIEKGGIADYPMLCLLYLDFDKSIEFGEEGVNGRKAEIREDRDS